MTGILVLYATTDYFQSIKLNMMLLKSIAQIALFAFLVAGCGSDNPSKNKGQEEAGFIAKPVMVPEQEVKTLEIGDQAPDFKLPGTDGKYHSLEDYSAADALLIIFTCNHCPTAQAYEERIKKVTADYKEKGLQVIAISPNSPLGLLHEELGYSDLGDSYEDMIVKYEDAGFNFPYLYDGDDQAVSLAYGPAATPHCFLFDKKRILQYIGRIDASEKPGTANAEDLRNAIDQVLSGTPVTLSTTKTFGCSTKWGWKTKMRAKVDKEWTEKIVTLEEVSLTDLKEIVANPSEKLRLINVWATWCAPCRLEYPEFVLIQRMFGARDFEFISISADKLDKKDNALGFLKSKHSALTNLIAESDDKYALIETIDPEWNGALPYTILIEPGGNVVWKHQGEVDFHKLKTAIVDHPMIGRVY